MKQALSGIGLIVAMTATVTSSAQEDVPAEDAAMEDAMMEEEAPAEEVAPAGDSGSEGTDANAENRGSGSGAQEPSSENVADGGRFRFGVAAGAGPMMADGLNMTYYGVDLRFGVQLNDALGIYAQPQIGYYQLDGGGLFASGGLIGTSVVADYTLFDRLFVGGGLGYAVLNNPSGLELHLRAGGYPLMGKSDTHARRKGLMLGLDFRLHFVEGYTFVAPTFNLGYEAF